MIDFIMKLFGKKEAGVEKAEEIPIAEEISINMPDNLVSENLTPELFQEILQKDGERNPERKLIDVRTAEEYNEEHIAGALLLPLQEFSTEKIDAVGLKKGDALFLYCRSGGRSSKAMQYFLSKGYRKVQQLDGGILAWKEKNLPLEK